MSRCLDCPDEVKGARKRCEPCRYQYALERQRERDRARAARRYAERRNPQLTRKSPLRSHGAWISEHHLPSARRYIYRPDFLLALTEMKAELVRQTGAMMMPVLLPSDPLEISSFRVANQRRGTGNGGRSA